MTIKDAEYWECNYCEEPLVIHDEATLAASDSWLLVLFGDSTQLDFCSLACLHSWAIEQGSAADLDAPND